MGTLSFHFLYLHLYANVRHMNTCHKHSDIDANHQCKACGSHCCDECIHEGTGICRGCLFKGAAIIIIIMVIISYTAWFGLFI